MKLEFRQRFGKMLQQTLLGQLYLSDLYIILNEAKQSGDNPSMFMSKIERYIDKDSLNSDSDMKNKLTRIYSKFIK